MRVGKSDAFEREYTQKFRLLAAEHGEFVHYDRDRAARDIGLHLTRKTPSGDEIPSTALCWFQLKGLTASSYTRSAFENAPDVPIRLEVRHLKFWYLQPMPTYLVVYIESVDEFLVLNIQKWVDDHFGRDILSVDQETITVHIPCKSTLDSQAFYLILRDNDFQAWEKALSVDQESIRLTHRDNDLIWNIGTADKRQVMHGMRFIDWQTKTRAEMHIKESSNDGTSPDRIIRNHWQFMLTIDDVGKAYPYLELFALDDDEDKCWDWETGDSVPLELPNGDVVYGTNIMDEVIDYELGVRLNELGERLFQNVTFLIEAGLIEIDEDLSEFISIAPWHGRAV